MAKSKKIFHEEYEIGYSYQTEDGYWRKGSTTIKIDLVGTLKHKEKSNHSEAERIFRKRYPSFVVDSVTYI